MKNKILLVIILFFVPMIGRGDGKSYNGFNNGNGGTYFNESNFIHQSDNIFSSIYIIEENLDNDVNFEIGGGFVSLENNKFNSVGNIGNHDIYPAGYVGLNYKMFYSNYIISHDVSNFNVGIKIKF